MEETNGFKIINLKILCFLFLASLLATSCAHFSSGKYVVVQDSDSYDVLGQRYNVNPERLKQMNHGRALVVGDHIFVPERGGLVSAIQEKVNRGASSLNGPVESPEISEAPEAIQGMDLIWPLPANRRISSPFGPRHGKVHMGVDIPAPMGTHILSAAVGRVTFAGWIKGYGKVVVVSHGNGVFTVYAHASKLLVRRGDDVDQGGAVAQVGRTGHSSGPHLHYEIRYQETPIDPLALYPEFGGRPHFATVEDEDSNSEQEL